MKRLQNLATNRTFVRKVNKCGIVINEQIIALAAIGERGVMKTKVVSLALILGMVALLGACSSGGTGGTGGETTSPSPAESPSTSPS